MPPTSAAATGDRPWEPTCAPNASFMETPVLGVDPERDRQMVDGVLVLYFDAGSYFTTNPIEYAKSFSRHSRFRVWNLNTFYPFPEPLAKFDFSAIVLHYTLFGAKSGPLGPLLGTPMYLLNEDHLAFFRSSRGRRIAVFQDEQTYCRARFRFCDDYGIDCVYTCLEPSEYEKTWHRYTRVPTVRTSLPGYVDSGLVRSVRRFRRPDGRRSIDVGYRGRPMPLFMEPGQEKSEIGRRFAELASGSGLRLDISVDEDARVYGRDWFRMLGDSRATLGVESGASVVDCEDEVRNDYERIMVEKGSVELSDLEPGPLSRWDNAIRYRTIGPRHFEAAALDSCQILFEGAYSEAMRPMEHYIPLRKDFSNLDQVVDLVSDAEVRHRLVESARRDLIESGDYGYERFVADFDRGLIEAGLDPEIDPADARAVDRAFRAGARRSRLRHWKWTRFDPFYARVIDPVYARVMKRLGRA